MVSLLYSFQNVLGHVSEFFYSSLYYEDFLCNLNDELLCLL